MKRSTAYRSTYEESTFAFPPTGFLHQKNRPFDVYELLYRHYSPIGIQGRFFWDNLNRK